jgi:hypothetical protein
MKFTSFLVKDIVYFLTLNPVECIAFNLASRTIHICTKIKFFQKFQFVLLTLWLIIKFEIYDSKLTYKLMFTENVKLCEQNSEIICKLTFTGI